MQAIKRSSVSYIEVDDDEEVDNQECGCGGGEEDFPGGCGSDDKHESGENSSQTKEMVVDFRRTEHQLQLVDRHHNIHIRISMCPGVFGNANVLMKNALLQIFKFCIVKVLRC